MEETYTWRKLKEFAMSLNEEQLNQPFIVCRDEEPVFKVEPEILREDCVYSVDNPEDCGFRSEMLETYTEEELSGDDFAVSFQKGTILLIEVQS